MLVGVYGASRGLDDMEADLAELARLADTAGGEVVGQVRQERERIHPATFVGRGKAEEVAREVTRLDADTVVFDEELSPAQIRNLEKITDAKVIDRSGIILDIFARRARTREAMTQVELAQMQYLLPRLTRRWTHLSRQAGGSGSLGLKGVGETQLEVDRRLIRRKIVRLKDDLARIEQGRSIRRSRRAGLFKVAIVGYTNAGKSTLFNALAGHDDAFVEDRLFATLDPTIRRCRTTRGDNFLLIDTVGFLRKLPVNLVASFRSTLEESADADLLLHVVDLSHPRYEEQMATTDAVLAELGLLERSRLTVFNKADAAMEAAGPGVLARAKGLFPAAFIVSARQRGGAESVRGAIEEAIGADEVSIEVRIPAERADLIGKLHAMARAVTESAHEANERFLFYNLRVGRENLQRILSMSGVEEVVA